MDADSIEWAVFTDPAGRDRYINLAAITNEDMAMIDDGLLSPLPLPPGVLPYKSWRVVEAGSDNIILQTEDGRRYRVLFHSTNDPVFVRIPDA